METSPSVATWKQHGRADTSYRSIKLTDPRSVGVDRIFGGHDLRICFPGKLRLHFDPSQTDEHSIFEEADDRLDVSLGEAWIRDWQEARTLHGAKLIFPYASRLAKRATR